jgi:hypothetical protein
LYHKVLTTSATLKNFSSGGAVSTSLPGYAWDWERNVELKFGLAIAYSWGWRRNLQLKFVIGIMI